jgi:DnaK suppressor protein
MTGKATRTDQLRQMLMERRLAVQDEVQSRIRAGRGEGATGVRDEVEQSDAGTQGDIARALLQLRADTLTRIDEALARIDAGTYGSCFECEEEISHRRLRALPFAVRCQACQERRERDQAPARRLAERRGGLSLFTDAIDS